MKAVHVTCLHKVQAIGRYFDQVVGVGHVDAQEARDKLKTIDGVGNYLSAHMLSVFQLLAGFRLTGNTELIYSEMHPAVTLMYNILPFHALRDMMIQNNMPDAANFSDRCLALAYCEAPKILPKMAVLPCSVQRCFDKGEDEVIEHLGALPMRQLLTSMAQAAPIPDDQLIRVKCDRHTERQLVDSCTQTFQLPSPVPVWYREQHFCLGAENMVVCLRKVLRELG